MPEALVCWKCGATLQDVPMPLSRLSVCLECHAELYACRMCRFYDSKLRQGCREDRAEHVLDKERANFCEFLVPLPDAYRPTDRSGEQSARAQLDALFGAPAEKAGKNSDSARAALEQVFKPKDRPD